MPEELAKQGTYSGSYGWSLSSTAHALDEGHIFSQDVFRGTFFNESGGGFLHQSSCVAPAVTELTDGEGTAHGVGTFTDKEDDKAFFVWKGTINAETGFSGDYQWTGGTGKYSGLKGNNTFNAFGIGTTTEGVGELKGEWQLP